MDSLASRYANALLLIAIQENDNEGYRQEIKELVNSFEQSEELLAVLKSSFITKKEKKDLLNEILKDEKYPKIRDFINVIIDNSRENFLIEFLQEFIRVSNTHDNISEGIIYSTKKLTKDEIEKVIDAVGSKLNRKINLRNRLDPSLIGGIKVVIDDHVFDGSIKNKLKNLKSQLSQGD